MSSSIRLRQHPAEQQLSAAQQEIETLRARLAVTEPVYLAHQARQVGRKLTREIRRHFELPSERALSLISARQKGLLVARPNWEELTALRDHVRELTATLEARSQSSYPTSGGDRLAEPSPDSVAQLAELYQQLTGEQAPGQKPSESPALTARDDLFLPMAGWTSPLSDGAPPMGELVDRVASPPLDRRIRRELEREARRIQRKVRKGH